jgi:hypothetical protein
MMINKKKKAASNKKLMIANKPSYDLNQPYVPGKQSYEGIPNASPEMLRRLQQRKVRNPGGQELPGFLRGA